MGHKEPVIWRVKNDIPTIIGRGVATANVYDFFLAEKKRTKRVCKWLDLNRQDVEAAVAFEQKLSAA